MNAGASTNEANSRIFRENLGIGIGVRGKKR